MATNVHSTTLQWAGPKMEDSHLYFYLEVWRELSTFLVDRKKANVLKSKRQVCVCVCVCVCLPVCLCLCLCFFVCALEVLGQMANVLKSKRQVIFGRCVCVCVFVCAGVSWADVHLALLPKSLSHDAHIYSCACVEFTRSGVLVTSESW